MTDELAKQIRTQFESSLEDFVRSSISHPYRGILEMIEYHMGWESGVKRKKTQGKRIRPLLVLYTTQAAGGQWAKALPAAWAVELIHNFSLIHDDIQDKSELRHGQATLWVKWGVAQAINSGDLLFNLAHEAINRLSHQQSLTITIEAGKVLSHACTELTGGQYLDLSYEKDPSISLDDYTPMILGKTAALLAVSIELGALCAGASSETWSNLRDFGVSLGLAFQMWDDWLGIWGDSLLTGKSSSSDLVSGKKSMPILYAYQQNKAFAKRWRQGTIRPDEVKSLSELLVEEGAQEFTQTQARTYTHSAQEALARAGLDPESSRLLRELTASLLDRHH